MGDDAVVEIKLTPTNPETWIKEETAWAKGNTTFIDLGISNKWGWVLDYKIGQNKSQFEPGQAQHKTIPARELLWDTLRCTTIPIVYM
ncbi:hypothetical protein [Mesotoga sp.]|uniref:hypothetical protein n=1 Tax=Mesotoga sp. TaxID=2053577 RepID=UPI00345EFCED